MSALVLPSSAMVNSLGARKLYLPYSSVTNKPVMFVPTATKAAAPKNTPLNIKFFKVFCLMASNNSTIIQAMMMKTK